MSNSHSQVLKFVRANDLPHLREALRDKNGMAVTLEWNMWRLNFGRIKPLDWSELQTTVVMEYAVRAWLEVRVSNLASVTAERDFVILRDLLNSTNWPDYQDGARHITQVREKFTSTIRIFLEQRSLKDKCEGEKRLESHLDTVRGWYRWSLEHELPGFDSEFVSELAEIKAPQRRNGQAVMSWDPGSGPLTRLEELQFRASLLRDSGPLSEQAGMWVTYGMGLRPQQTVLLLEKDLKIFVASNGEKFYQLDVPRVKRKGEPIRSELRRRKIGAQLGALLEKLIDENQAITTEPDFERPLLIRTKPLKGMLDGEMRPWAYMRNANYIADSLRRFVTRNNIVSVRTKKPLNASPRRLRYTFATNKAESLEPAVLAELLDHSDIRSVLVYYNAREAIAEELGQKLGKMDGQDGYQTIINSFAGIPIKVVPRETEKQLGGPELVVSCLRRLSQKTCGSC